MKIYIRAAEDDRKSYGTTFYRITLDKLKSVLGKDNIWIDALIEKDGFDCLPKRLYGSKEIGDTFFLCVTDGEDIEVKGEMVDPESALDEYSLSDLSDYIKDATDKIIKDNIDPEEFEFNEREINDLAYDMIRKGTRFTDMYDAYAEIMPNVD